MSTEALCNECSKTGGLGLPNFSGDHRSASPVPFVEHEAAGARCLLCHILALFWFYHYFIHPYFNLWDGNVYHVPFYVRNGSLEFDFVHT